MSRPNNAPLIINHTAIYFCEPSAVAIAPRTEDITACTRTVYVYVVGTQIIVDGLEEQSIRLRYSKPDATLEATLAHIVLEKLPQKLQDLSQQSHQTVSADTVLTALSETRSILQKAHQAIKTEERHLACFTQQHVKTILSAKYDAVLAQQKNTLDYNKPHQFEKIKKCLAQLLAELMYRTALYDARRQTPGYEYGLFKKPKAGSQYIAAQKMLTVVQSANMSFQSSDKMLPTSLLVAGSRQPAKTIRFKCFTSHLDALYDELHDIEREMQRFNTTPRNLNSPIAVRAAK